MERHLISRLEKGKIDISRKAEVFLLTIDL